MNGSFNTYVGIKIGRLQSFGAQELVGEGVIDDAFDLSDLRVEGASGGWFRGLVKRAARCLISKSELMDGRKAEDWVLSQFTGLRPL